MNGIVSVLRMLAITILALCSVGLILIYWKSSVLLIPPTTHHQHSCPLVPPLQFEVHGISPRKRPKFSLATAWLKPELARYGPAPKTIPELLKSEYRMHDTIQVAEFYFDQAYLGANALVTNWTLEMFENYRKQVKERKSFSYDATPIYAALDIYANTTIKSKKGVVIGSEMPWLESILLEYGAAHVTTVEFGHIKSDHPQVDTYLPRQFTLDFLYGDVETFDFAFIYSSIEHDGLGRYGDVLNPSGDLETMAKMLSVVKPGGYLYLGVPCCLDALHWNAHRIYGSKRFAELFAGWQIVGLVPANSMKLNQTLFTYTYQPVWVLQNVLACSPDEAVNDVKGLLKSLKL